MKLKSVKAVGDYVVLKLVEQHEKDKVTESGIILPGQKEAATTVANSPSGGKTTVAVYIDSIGANIDTKSCGFNVGDEVIVNDYDLQTIGDDNGNMYGLCKAESVKAVVESERS